MAFISSVSRTLILFSLSHTLSHLEKSWSIIVACLEHSSFHWIWKKKERESEKSQGIVGSIATKEFLVGIKLNV